MSLSANYLVVHADALERILLELERSTEDEAQYLDVHRCAAIRRYEASLDTAGKLLRKALKAFTGRPRDVDAWVFNDLLRHAGKHGLLDCNGVQRWIHYRANVDKLVFDAGGRPDSSSASDTLSLLPQYLNDMRVLAERIQEVFNAAA